MFLQYAAAGSAQAESPMGMICTSQVSSTYTDSLVGVDGENTHCPKIEGLAKLSPEGMAQENVGSELGFVTDSTWYPAVIEWVVR